PRQRTGAWPLPARARAARRCARALRPSRWRNCGARNLPGRGLPMITLLIVDDHAVLRAGLRSRLRGEPDIGEIWEAADAVDAVVKARAYRPRVVLLDLLMPRVSGYDAIPRITEVSPQSRIVVCSAMSGASAVRQALAAGAAG